MQNLQNKIYSFVLQIKLSWNWWAFVFVWTWYFYRGMIARGFFLMLFYIVGAGIITALPQSFLSSLAILLFLPGFHIYCGLFGEKHHRNHLEFKQMKQQGSGDAPPLPWRQTDSQPNFEFCIVLWILRKIFHFAFLILILLKHANKVGQVDPLLLRGTLPRNIYGSGWGHPEPTLHF